MLWSSSNACHLQFPHRLRPRKRLSLIYWWYTWSALLLLAAKPYQESCIDINKFILRLCITYCPLTSVTRTFEFLIPRCSDSIEDLGDSYGNLFSISLDARSGYHQIKVRPCDQGKLALFTPNSKNKCFVVILFGPKNVPAVYTAMMRILKDKWIILFNNTKHIVISDLFYTNTFCNSHKNIDDTLIYSNHISTLSLALIKSSPNIDFRLNWVNMTSFFTSCRICRP